MSVTLVAPRVALHPDLNCGSGDLVETARNQMVDADPFGSFHGQSSPPASVHDLALCIGGVNTALSFVRAVFVNATGWMAGVSVRAPVPISNPENGTSIGALAAACLGVAQVFKLALGWPAASLIRDGIFDMFELDWTDAPGVGPIPSPDVGRMLMVGAGAVGSSAAYCMRLAGLEGQVTILDKDVVEIPNLNRSPVFDRRSLGRVKSEVVAAHLAGSALSATASDLWWDDYIAQHVRSTFRFDVWLPLANERGVRSAMQHSVPPAMVHASTTANWGVNHGRHIPSADDCLADRFPDETDAAPLACASGQVMDQEEQIDAALPFCSLFAGLLVTAELLRLQLEIGPPVPNFAMLDWHGTLDTLHKWDKEPRLDCICREQGLETHAKFNEGTRHWSRFRF